MKRNCALLVIFTLALAVPGCEKSPTDPQPASSGEGSRVSAEAAKFLLDAEPAGAVDVIKVRETAKDGDDVVIVGRIGGREDPWINNRAAFLIVDPSLKSCHDTGCLDCEKPWDYC